MSEERPLPDPRKRPHDRAGQQDELLADGMTRAMAEGRLEEFIEKEFKGNENARKLAGMMMEMTGMAGMARPPAARPGGEEPAREPDAPRPAPDIKEATAAAAPQGEAPSKSGVPEQLARIAAENGVEVEWVVSRALSLYIRDYRTTGRL